MPEFICRGSVRQENITFFITADSIEDAKGKARDCKFDYYENDVAEIVDVTMDVGTIEENK